MWAPLVRPVFRWLWIAALVSNIGTWMHDVGAGWLMTRLASEDDRHVLVSLVQAATTLPLFLLVLPAGALADVVDRRKILLGAQLAMLVTATALALFTWHGDMTPEVLLLLTLGLGMGAAITNPAWQTVMTDLVPRDELPQASALNSVSINLSRAIGPALGGLVVAAAGEAAAFALNAVSFVAIIAVLALWRYKRPASSVPGERFVGALKAGVRYVRYSPPMKALLVRTLLFSLFASAIWALLPLLVKDVLKTDERVFGLMVTCLGVGAVAGAAVLGRLRAKFTPSTLVVAAAVMIAASLTTMALVPIAWVACVVAAVAGLGWLLTVTSLNVSAQSGTPPWVRARALATYLCVFYGGMTIGSATWGVVAKHFGIETAFLVAAGGLLAGLLTLPFAPLKVSTAEQLTKTHAWEDPEVARPVEPDDGPVIVTVEYFVLPQNAAAFRKAMEPVALTRYRDGAFSWMLSHCVEDPQRWLEVFMVDSWAEHLRQHDRVTAEDKRVQDASKVYHIGPGRPKVWHYIAAGVEPRLAPPPDSRHSD